MKFITQTENIFKSVTDLLVVGQTEGKIAKDNLLEKVDSKLGKELSRLLKKEGFAGKKGETKLLYTQGKLKAKYILVLGLGDKKKLNLDVGRLCGATIQGFAAKTKAAKVLCDLSLDKSIALSLPEFLQAVTEGFVLGSYKFTRYIKSDKTILKQVSFFCTPKDQKNTNKNIRLAQTWADGVFLARDLVNMPAVDMTPLIMAREAKKLKGVRTRVYNQAALRKMKMGLFLSVSAGSTKNPPCLIEMHYKPKQKPKKQIALIGKGVTFDTGGYSLKPSKGMDGMKCDMAGGAAVIGFMSIVSRLKPKVEIWAYVPATENMVSGYATRPGDIFKAMNGKTVEITNTDAEGRLILADTMVLAGKKKPDYMIDMATLTGACLVALGFNITGLLGNDQALVDKLKASADVVGESVWQLPLQEEYRDELKSPFADLKNVGVGYAGAITAALFLENFVGKTKWAHLDIAGPAWTDKPLTYSQRGGTGVMVRTLAHFLGQF